MRMLLLTPEQASVFDDYQNLEPREIAAGEHAGQFALPARVIDDPMHEGWRDQLLALPEVEINPTEAWPPEDE